jgi:2,4-dienoyl-CoA reductase-like NADH-dependent reductase (Old Yellow Enzyme family)/thioredoxin reductase
VPGLDYPSLASPIRVRDVSIRNRLVMAPLCAMYAAPDGSVTSRVVEYYRARARGGAGLIIVEITFTDAYASRAFHAQLGAHSDMMIPGLNELAEAIKGEGAIAGLQIGHCGSQRVISEPPIVAPSPIPWAPGKRVPQELTLADIASLVETHADAARRVAAAGFDLVELHGAHGYLLNTFLCPATNRRSDAYGGSLENRLRFPLAVVGAVRKALGPRRLLSYRINGDDLLSGGLEVEDYGCISRHLAAAGVDILHVSAGTYRVMEQRIAPMYIPEAPFIAYAGPLRRASGLPVIASGTIHDPDTADELIARGEADFVSMARPLFADPQLPNKLFSRRRREIVPCIRCNTCLGREQSGWRGLCAVNPHTGHEHEPVAPAQAARRVLVVGAGPGGIQAALTAAARGHTVDLVERGAGIGGKLRIAATLDFKPTIARLLDYWRHALETSGVNLALGGDAPRFDPTDREVPEFVILATGAGRDRPHALEGLETAIVPAEDALENPAVVGPRALVIGATTVGAETAWRLAELGRCVTLIDDGSDFADDVNLISRIVFLQRFAELGIEFLPGTKAVAGRDGQVKLDVNGGRETGEFDTIVMACSLDLGPARRQAETYRQAGAKVLAVGECAGYAGIIGATRSGHRAACRI